jgi:poly(3-hydroxyalkanoate) synthetase
LAFFDMQARGVEAGAFAAKRIANIFCGNDELCASRIHFIGHSFGGLLVSNAVRHLVHNANFKGRIASLCLLQGLWQQLV